MMKKIHNQSYNLTDKWFTTRLWNLHIKVRNFMINISYLLTQNLFSYEQLAETGRKIWIPETSSFCIVGFNQSCTCVSYERLTSAMALIQKFNKPLILIYTLSYVSVAQNHISIPFMDWTRDVAHDFLWQKDTMFIIEWVF